jgi:uncharacterized protein (TIGR03118 family)
MMENPANNTRRPVDRLSSIESDLLAGDAATVGVGLLANVSSARAQDAMRLRALVLADQQAMNRGRGVQSRFARSRFSGASAVAAFLCLSMFPAPARAQYQRTDLVSNQAGAAPLQDTHLVNGWGLVSLATSPYWVSDNGTGFSTLYTAAGTQVPLFVTIPAAPSSPTGTIGTPTGVVGNIGPNPTDFTITANNTSGKTAFIFATLDGTISGWTPTVDPITAGNSTATIAADRSSVGAVYTGLAIAVNESKEAFLYAADDGQNRRVDMFDSSFHFVKSFRDPLIPRDFAPYGIQAINGKIWVTYTSLTNKPGGFVDVFDTDGRLVRPFFALFGPLNSPWGVALAPANFGRMSNAILISNNTPQGRINAFNPETGEFLGPLRDDTGRPIQIDQLWAIQFGQGAASNGPTNQLFFTAGPSNYANGLFGTITLVK